VNQTCFP